METAKRIPLTEAMVMKCAHSIHFKAYRILPSLRNAFSEVNMILNALRKV